jgi:L-lysine exporter family protein LysE/ArgO
MTTYLSAFMGGFFLSAALIVAIGAQNLFVLKQGLMRQHVGAVVLFCGFVDASLIILGVSGVGVLLGSLPQLTRTLAVGGSLFLAWYGIKAFQRMKSSESMEVADGNAMSLGRALAATAAFTLLNPHVYLDTVLLMGTAGSAQPVALRPLFVAGAATASFSWFALLGYGARLLTPVFARPVAWRVLDGMVGLVMLSISATLVVHAFS